MKKSELTPGALIRIKEGRGYYATHHKAIVIGHDKGAAMQGALIEIHKARCALNQWDFVKTATVMVAIEEYRGEWSPRFVRRENCIEPWVVYAARANARQKADRARERERERKVRAAERLAEALGEIGIKASVDGYDGSITFTSNAVGDLAQLAANGTTGDRSVALGSIARFARAS